MKNRKLVLFFSLAFLCLNFLYLPLVSCISWTGENRFTWYPYGDRYPSVYQTKDNNIWVVWDEEIQSGRTIIAKKSSNYGVTWSVEKNLTVCPSFDMNQDPSITQLLNGTMIVVWSAHKVPPPPPDFDISADPSYLIIPRGNSDTSNITVTSLRGYSAPVELSAKSVIPYSPYVHYNLAPTQVTPPPNGHANSTLFITVDPQATPKNYTITVIGYSPSLNVTHSVPVRVNVTETSGFSASNEALPLFNPSEEPGAGDNYEIFYKVSHDNGTSWSNEVKLVEDSSFDLSPSVLQASNGTIWVVWASNRLGNFEVYYKVSHDGVSWSNDTPLTSNSYTDAFPAIAQMDDGRIWVVWHTNRDGNNEIYYNIYSSAWMLTDYRLTSDTGISNTTPAILQTSDGVIWIFWKSMSNTQPPYIVYKQSLNNGASWSSTIQFTFDLNEDVTSPGVAQTNDERIWVFWAALDGNWDIYHKTSMVHNVAVTDVTTSLSRVYQGEMVPINAKVQNRGDYNESAVTVNCFTNLTPLNPQITSVDSKKSKTVTFWWNTSTYSRGDYRIKANASAVPNETYLGDNSFLFAGTVRVKLLGDVDDNGMVTVSDLYPLGKAYGSTPSSGNWNEEGDMNGDNVINNSDLALLEGNFGKTG
jgi:hypothetical protein